MANKVGPQGQTHAGGFNLPHAPPERAREAGAAPMGARPQSLGRAAPLRGPKPSHASPYTAASEPDVIQHDSPKAGLTPFFSGLQAFTAPLAPSVARPPHQAALPGLPERGTGRKPPRGLPLFESLLGAWLETPAAQTQAARTHAVLPKPVPAHLWLMPDFAAQLALPQPVRGAQQRLTVSTRAVPVTEDGAVGRAVAVVVVPKKTAAVQETPASGLPLGPLVPTAVMQQREPLASLATPASPTALVGGLKAPQRGMLPRKPQAPKAKPKKRFFARMAGQKEPLQEEGEMAGPNAAPHNQRGSSARD